jgi:hypothetical protein
MDEGELAVINSLEDVGFKQLSGHVHPSTTVYTYALSAATLGKVHRVTFLLVKLGHTTLLGDPFIL